MFKDLPKEASFKQRVFKGLGPFVGFGGFGSFLGFGGAGPGFRAPSF